MTDGGLLVIGYGNVLRRDDGAGWFAARKLARRLPPGSAEVKTVHQLLPELAEPISRAGRVAFIDADANLPPGRWERRSLQPAASSALGAHHQSPGGLLLMAAQLYGQSPAAVIYRIGGADFAHGYGLSPAVRVSVTHLVQAVLAAIQCGQDTRCG